MNKIDTSVRGALAESQRRRDLDRVAGRFGFAHAHGIGTLYKFKSLRGQSREYTIDIIRNNRIYFPRPDELNDPFDCAPEFKLGGDPSDEVFVSELLASQQAFEKRHAPQEVERLRRTEGVQIEDLAAAVVGRIRADLCGTTRLLSLSAHRMHPLLWAHYAANHSGICLHFETKPGTLFGHARKVAYKSRREPIVISPGLPGAEEFFEKLVMVKADFWGYENEYRVLGVTDNRIEWGGKFDEKGRVSFPRNLLTGITLGMRIAPDDRNEIIARAAEPFPPIPVWQASMHPELFEMKPTAVS